MQVVANGDIAGAPATAGNLADLLSLDAEDAAGASATASAAASSAVTALQDLLSGDLSAEVAAAGRMSQVFLSLSLQVTILGQICACWLIDCYYWIFLVRVGALARTPLTPAVSFCLTATAQYAYLSKGLGQFYSFQY